MFTKCKKNIRDGFRLENLSWRLWYRQSVLHKKIEPHTSEDIDIFSTSTEERKQLTRTRSLPDLSQWSHQKNTLLKHSSTTLSSGQITPSSSSTRGQQQKMFMIDDDEETESEFELEDVEEEEVIITFTKKIEDSSYCHDKSVSLLTDMLEEEQNNSGLRRCQSRYYRLDQYFASTA